MANTFVEPRPKGRKEGQPIEDYVVENASNSVLHTAKTQEDAIKWAKANGHAVHVARVRHLNDKSIPNQWRLAIRRPAQTRAKAGSTAIVPNPPR
jgi:hypothetical protein